MLQGAEEGPASPSRAYQGNHQLESMTGSRISFDRALGLATIGALLLGSVLFALPAAAADEMVTGYETGYQYRQGLATGAGAALMSANNSASPQNATVLGATTEPTIVAQNASFTPGINESIVDPVPNTEPTPALASEATTAFSASQLFAPAMLAIVIALLALLGLAIWAVTGPVEDSARTRRYRYQ